MDTGGRQLARERHFGHAADKFHFSQPTLSLALKKIEQPRGVILFERSSADVRLTPIGRQVAARAERMLEEAIKLREIATQVAIGCPANVASVSSTPMRPTCYRA